ncbi:MAG: DNA recombination protein RmuC [Saprospiraceae bacterium]|nr:DNA recombination protein RmuC [Saprospiraceae bacterium]MBP9210647.1 DNA recombination protein RmuC [Saprospiraceae bacterium]
MESFDVLSFLLGACLGLVALLFVRQALSREREAAVREVAGQAARLQALEEQNRMLRQELEQHFQRHEARVREVADQLAVISAQKAGLDAAREQLARLDNELNASRGIHSGALLEISTLREQLAARQNENKFLLEKLDNQRSEFDALRKQAQLEFQQIANRILEEKSQRFANTNKEAIDAILKPLGENLESFKKKVEETYDKESKQRFSLEEKVRELIQMNHRLSQEANNLTSALKGQSKKQGNWGEVILESILEKSGLVKNREYVIQQSVQTEEGRRLQPDIVVYLPESRAIVIDSKVTLVAYDRYVSAEETEAQELAARQHIQSIYRHIDQLSEKKYDTVAGTLDFTMMFIPIEPAYLLAIQMDPELWAYAYAKRILLISPTNLIAALKLVADLWKREHQSRNALEIARQGERLYEKVVGFLDTMEDMGRHIAKTQDSYFKAVGQLKDGRGSVVKQAQTLRRLGLNSEKEIPEPLLPADDEV